MLQAVGKKDGAYPSPGMRPACFLPGEFQHEVMEDLGHNPESIRSWFSKELGQGREVREGRSSDGCASAVRVRKTRKEKLRILSYVVLHEPSIGLSWLQSGIVRLFKPCTVGAPAAFVAAMVLSFTSTFRFYLGAVMLMMGMLMTLVCLLLLVSGCHVSSCACRMPCLLAVAM